MDIVHDATDVGGRGGYEMEFFVSEIELKDA